MVLDLCMDIDGGGEARSTARSYMGLRFFRHAFVRVWPQWRGDEWMRCGGASGCWWRRWVDVRAVIDVHSKKKNETRAWVSSCMREEEGIREIGKSLH